MNMDIFETRGIKVPNALLIQGITKTVSDEEVLDFLKPYGSIAKTELIDDSDSVFHNSLIVEYKTGEALCALRKILPYEFICDSSKASYDILEVSTVCAKEIGKLKTQSYVSELKNLAKLTGQDYGVVLIGVMSLFGQSVAELCPIAVQVKTPSEDSESELGEPFSSAADIQDSRGPLSEVLLGPSIQ